MPTDQPWNVYREQLWSLYLGIALWEPEPVKGFYDKVLIGDVGYVYNGFFYRMFNVKLPWDDLSNQKISKDPPENYKAMDLDLFAIHTTRFKKGEHCSPRVVRYENTEYMQARVPRDEQGSTYECKGPGALLSLPHDGHRESLMREKAFEEYIRDNVGSWFDWSKRQKLPVDRMEDLILVTECTLVKLWAAAAFIGRSETAKIALVSSPEDSSGPSFEFRNFGGDVAHNCSYFDSGDQSHGPNQCVFIKGFRAKRIMFWTKPIRAAAEPVPDDPDDNREDEIQVTRVQDASKYRDPLIGVLDYIIEKCPDGTIAITHDDDLQLVENVETLSADSVEQFLREKQFPVLIGNGVACLRGQLGDIPSVLDDPNAFFVTAELGGKQTPAISSFEPDIAARPSGKISRGNPR